MSYFNYDFMTKILIGLFGMTFEMVPEGIEFSLFCTTFKMAPLGIKFALFLHEWLATRAKKCKFYAQGCHFQKEAQKSPT